MSQQTLDKINTKCTNLRSQLNRMNKSLDKIRQDINNSSKPNSNSKNTNHELATAEAPLDSELDEYRNVQKEHLDNFKQAFENSKSEISDFEEIIESTNPDVFEMSSDMGEVRGYISEIKDNFSFLVTYRGSERVSTIMDYILFRNLKIDKNDNKSELEQLIEDNKNMIDNISRNVQNLSNLVQSIDIDDVKEDIDEERRNIAEKEMEHMKPFMDLNRVENLCSSGETISASDFAHRLSDNSKYMDYSADSAKEILENAVEVSSPQSEVSLNVQKKSNKYRIE